MGKLSYLAVFSSQYFASGLLKTFRDGKKAADTSRFRVLKVRISLYAREKFKTISIIEDFSRIC